MTVVMPVHNSGQFIDETFQCIRDKTLCVWVLGNVNDGSTDDATKFTEERPTSDAQFRVIRQANSGL